MAQKIALDPALGLTPAALAAAWNANPPTVAHGPAHTEAALRGQFMDFAEMGFMVISVTPPFDEKVEFRDEHNIGITLRSLARRHRASGEATLPAAVATILGITPAEEAALLAQATDEADV